MPPAGNAYDDQFRIDLEECLGAESDGFQHARAETLDEYRRRLDELEHDIARFGVTQFKAKALLVARIEFPVGGDAFGFPGAQRVAGGRLDFNDLGTKIAE